MSMWPPSSEDPDLTMAGQRFRDELRAEAEEDEALAARDLLRVRSLGDVALELLARGDQVAARLGGRTFTGVVAHAAGDLACLQTQSGVVDLRLGAPLVLRVVERVRHGGSPRGRGAESFAARLAEHELAGTAVELVTIPGEVEVIGRIRAVARDHAIVALGDGADAYVSLTAIAAAIVHRP